LLAVDQPGNPVRGFSEGNLNPMRREEKRSLILV